MDILRHSKDKAKQHLQLRMAGSRNETDNHEDAERGQTILKVLDDSFGDLLKGDPSAISNKYRKMAASPFAFYRGSACLFYHDVAHAQADGSFINERTGRIWMHGDLHAENFGTYMNSQGRLIFNVNDFDEAYVGPFLWDLKRFVASIALIAYSKALSDKQITTLVEAYAKAYADRIKEIVSARENMQHVDHFTLSTAKGPLLETLKSASTKTRAALLDSMTEVRDAERRFIIDDKAKKLEDNMRKKVIEAFEKYLHTLPESSQRRPGSTRVKDAVGRRGVGIGSAGLPSYNVLLEGNTQALENDLVVYMKQSQPAAVSRYARQEAAHEKFEHEGHRTVVSERALQSHAGTSVGWTELEGKGMLVSELSPYAVDLDWSDINELEEMESVVADLGRATAMMHAAGDDDREHSDVVPFSPEEAISAAVWEDKDGFVKLLADFSHDYSKQVRQDHQIFVDLFRNGRIPGL
ncbi:hypothetical protein GGR57DRAFT_240302 [Xylariaceae sp. FL1272]|nr:hypothetical protein GGR57DRAFT_240302 [Xylariaceae sp. FL1272]